MSFQSGPGVSFYGELLEPLQIAATWEGSGLWGGEFWGFMHVISAFRIPIYTGGMSGMSRMCNFCLFSSNLVFLCMYACARVCVPIVLDHISNPVVFLIFQLFQVYQWEGLNSGFFFQIHIVSCNSFNKQVKPIRYIMSFLFCTHFIGASVNPGELGSRKEGRKLVISTNVVLTGV